MLLRLKWFFILCIYLSVNGQLFAMPMQTCKNMTMTQKMMSLSAMKKFDKSLNNVSMVHHSDKKPAYHCVNCYCQNCHCSDGINEQIDSLIARDEIKLVNIISNFNSYQYTIDIYNYLYTIQFYKPHIYA